MLINCKVTSLLNITAVVPPTAFGYDPLFLIFDLAHREKHRNIFLSFSEN